MRYTIQDTTLTALGDAVRAKTGETEYRDIAYESKDYRLDRTHFYYDQYLSIPVDGAVSMQVTPISYVSYSGDFQIYAVNCTIPETITAYGTEPFMMTNFTSLDHVGLHHLTPGDSGLKYNFSVIRYDADGNIIPFIESKEVKKTMTPERMVTAITDLPPAPSKEKLTFSGDLSYAFYRGTMDWVVNDYGEDVTFENVDNLYFTFNISSAYPVNGIHCTTTTASKANNGSHAFNGYDGTQLPMVYNFTPSQMDSMFAGMDYVREFPEGFGDDWDFSYIEGLTSSYSGTTNEMFSNCYSLRKIPMNLLHGNPVINYNYHIYKGMCNSCYVLDELIDIPNVHWNGVYNSTSASSSIFRDMVKACCRLKDFTFASNFEVNGLPVKWANQVLDLSTVGYKTVADYTYFSRSQYSGCTQDKLINSNETYALLKDDPDATANNPEWSRYDKASALRTIASLPDCSAYQTQNNQGANIIKFKGTSGSLTDGGAINTLTDEEIAVAAAKGWTVTLV